MHEQGARRHPVEDVPCPGVIVGVVDLRDGETPLRREAAVSAQRVDEVGRS